MVLDGSITCRVMFHRWHVVVVWRRYIDVRSRDVVCVAADSGEGFPTVVNFSDQFSAWHQTCGIEDCSSPFTGRRVTPVVKGVNVLSDVRHQTERSFVEIVADIGQAFGRLFTKGELRRPRLHIGVLGKLGDRDGPATGLGKAQCAVIER